MIIAIILAAGESTRMSTKTGEPRLKQLLPFGKSTILESVLQTLLYSKIDEIVVVLGHQAGLIRKKIKSYNVSITLNKQYKKGMLTSIQCGVKYSKKRFGKSKNDDAVLLCLGDQPSVHPSVIEKLLKKFPISNSGILIPVYRKKRGHPILIRAKYCNEILKIPLEKGLRELMQNHSQDIHEIPVSSCSILKDIDTPEEYRKALKHRNNL
jgi:molybdenum cofactor cytidylyltransferase